MAEPSLPARVAPPIPAAPEPLPEQRSTMLERFGILARLVVRFLFRHVHVRPEAVAHVRQLAGQGTLVYVMRYRSPLDYLLVNAILLREGLPLARFAPGVSTVPFRPLGDMLGWIFRRRQSTSIASRGSISLWTLRRCQSWWTFGPPACRVC